jgi:hypothetical protein
MPARKKTDVLKRYQAELQRGINWRNGDDYDGLWRRMIDLYKGKHYANMSSADRIVVNRAFATKNVIAPSVAVNNPKFTVEARKPEEAPQAIITQEVLNYLWRVNRYRKEFRLAVDDMLIVGHGWMKVGYKFVQETAVKNAGEDSDDAEGATEDGVDDREPVDGNVEHEKKVVDDRPFVERISIFDMFVDPDARHLGEARWIAQRVKRPVADVRVDSRYKPTHAKKAMATNRDAYDHSDDDTTPRDQNGVSKGFVDVWEFYDLREKTVSTFISDYTDGFLVDPKPIPYAFGHPFVMLRDYDVPDQFYPMGELEAIEALQLELNATRTDQIQHRKSFNRKYLYSEEAINGEEALEALHSSEDNVMVPINTTAVDLDNVIRPMPTNQIPGDLYNMSSVIEGDIDIITGVSDYMRGGPTANIRRTATEAAMIQDSQNARAADKLAAIEETLSEIGEKLIALMQQFMTGQQVVRVVGSSGMNTTWVNFDKDWIAGNFDFTVEGGSTQPVNESFRAQRAMQLMDALAPFISMGVADPVAVMRKVLQDGFGVKDATQFLAQQDPMMDPMAGGGPQALPPGGGMPMGGGEEMPPESAIPGIPAELLNRLSVEPSPVMQ